MKISYPLRDTSGKEFRSLEDVMRLIDGEAHGTWLLGANGLWHGGIHISDISNPFSALNPDAINTGEPVPLQFMADGIIVAYRLNNEYLTAPYCGQQLRYSSSFVLVKSQSANSSRATQVTEGQPRIFNVLATSIATSPPPIINALRGTLISPSA